MAQKMTLSTYLAQRGKKAKALTKGEAALLGIPFPLQSGWPRRYGWTEIDEAMLERLASCTAAARRASEEKAARAQVEQSAAARPMVPAVRIPPAVKVVCGFVLRKPRRQRGRRPAPWA